MVFICGRLSLQLCLIGKFSREIVLEIVLLSPLDEGLNNNVYFVLPHITSALSSNIYTYVLSKQIQVDMQCNGEEKRANKMSPCNAYP